MQVLIIEDEPRAARQLRSLLEASGYAFKLLHVIDSVEEALGACFTVGRTNLAVAVYIEAGEHLRGVLFDCIAGHIHAVEVQKAVVSLNILDTQLDLSVGEGLVLVQIGETKFENASLQLYRNPSLQALVKKLTFPPLGRKKNLKMVLLL